MPRPTTIVDRVALAEVRLLRNRSGVGFVRLEKFKSAQAAREEFCKQRELASARPRYLRDGTSRVVRVAAPIGVVIFIAALAFAPELTKQLGLGRMSLLLIPFLLLLQVVAIVVWFATRARNKSLAGVRYLRVRPLRMIERIHDATACVPPELVTATEQTLADRLATRKSLTRARRVTDAALPGTRMFVIYIACMMLAVGNFVILFSRPISLQYLTPLMFVPVLFVPLGLRQSYSKNIDKRREMKLCPGCKFDCSALPSDPLMQSLELDVGPKRCSECGMLWPFVPPATAEEILKA